MWMLLRNTTEAIHSHVCLCRPHTHTHCRTLIVLISDNVSVCLFLVMNPRFNWCAFICVYCLRINWTFVLFQSYTQLNTFFCFYFRLFSRAILWNTVQHCIILFRGEVLLPIITSNFQWSIHFFISFQYCSAYLVIQMNGHACDKQKNISQASMFFLWANIVIPLLFIETSNNSNRKKISLWFYFRLCVSVTDFSGMFPPKPQNQHFYFIIFLQNNRNLMLL